MRNLRAHGAAVAFGFAAAVSLSALDARPAAAQQPPSGPPPAGVRDPFAEVRERQQREAQLRSAEMLGTSKPMDRRNAEAAAEQMREDFRLIQVLRNKVVRQLKSEKPLDYELIARETEEINKRASRLKAQLVRETPEGDKKAEEKPLEISDKEVTSALVRMCKRIDSFTENPVFKLADVVDVEQTAKAGRDLRDIILLSDAVKRTAERLDKLNKK
ncbi:MAG TPA: hypothetical protein VFX96_10480 [Pyrinomonadaceae bacterium]|nr:hypothetical protein [Pyrinomonadaceae bacterium]